jgi:hypothetical protein
MPRKTPTSGLKSDSSENWPVAGLCYQKMRPRELPQWRPMDVFLKSFKKTSMISAPLSSTLFERKRAPCFEDTLSLQNNHDSISIIDTSDGGTWHPR